MTEHHLELEQSVHQHDFGQAVKRPVETRMLVVTLLTFFTMIVEISVGVYSGSMALLADGIHMLSHTLALGLAALAYFLVRRLAQDRRFSLGSGKINDLAAFSSALFLLIFCLGLIVESCSRLFKPQDLKVVEALLVGSIGLLVNLASLYLLHGSEHDHGHSHEHDHAHDHQHEDRNLRAAWVHILADVLTSVAAVLGLIAVALWGWTWVDATIGLIASIIIMCWTFSLLKSSSSVLLDMQASRPMQERIKQRLQEIPGTQIEDLHIWCVGQNAWTLAAVIVSHKGAQAQDYRQKLSDIAELHHPIIEIRLCQQC